MERGVFCNNKCLKTLPRILAEGCMKAVQYNPMAYSTFYYSFNHFDMKLLCHIQKMS